MYHSQRNIRLVVHGEDFTALGKAEQLDWYRKVVMHRVESKVKGLVGPGRTDGKSMRVRNRIITMDGRRARV